MCGEYEDIQYEIQREILVYSIFFNFFAEQFTVDSRDYSFGDLSFCCSTFAIRLYSNELYEPIEMMKIILIVSGIIWFTTTNWFSIFNYETPFCVLTDLIHRWKAVQWCHSIPTPHLDYSIGCLNIVLSNQLRLPAVNLLCIRK